MLGILNTFHITVSYSSSTEHLLPVYVSVKISFLYMVNLLNLISIHEICEF